MKQRSIPFSLIPALAISALLAACSASGGDSAQTSDVAVTAKSSWRLNEVAYSSTARTTSTSESSALTIVGVGTDGADQSNGAYAGSSLLIAHSLTSPGEYRVVASLEAFMAATEANPADKVAHIAVTVGTASHPVAATRYESVGTGTLAVTIDENGDYHFTGDQPIAVSKVVDLGNGVPDAPESAQLLVTDIHDSQ